MTKISVIIPVLNSEKYIRECMDSIVGQTLHDIEIIPVDAGSTDGTLEILERYAVQDKRIRILHSDKKSMGHQYNMGISEAKGEFIGFCESDDYISESMYEKLYGIARNHDLDYVKSDFDMFIDKRERIFLNYHILAGNRAMLYEKVIYPSDHPDIIYRDVNMWNGIYKREFVKNRNIKFNESAGAAFQDIGFVLQSFLAAKRAMYVNEDANRYRRDNIASSVYNLKGIVNVVQEAEFSEKYLRGLNVMDEFIRAVIFHRFSSLFFGFYGKLPVKDLFTEDVKEAISSFAQIAKRKYQEIPYYAMAFVGLEKSLSLKILMKDLDKFDELRRWIEKMEKDCLYKFLEYIESYPRAVIFGAGEIGTALYAMLQKNDYYGVIGFSDNDPGKWGKRLMGKKILSPNELAGLNDGKTIFIIAMVSHNEVIKEQLISIKIGREHVCKAVAVIPHNAMEISIKDMETKGENRQ